VLLDIVCEKRIFINSKNFDHNILTLIKDYVEMKYTCFSNKNKELEIAKIIFKVIIPITRTEDLRCTQEQSSATNFSYIVYFNNWNGSDHDMTVQYLKKNRRKIYDNGSLMKKLFFKN
jgi:hypothetical protein